MNQHETSKVAHPIQSVASKYKYSAKIPMLTKKHATDSDSDDSSSASKEGSPDLGTAERAPTFENHIHWWNLNPCVDEDTIPSPPFEVGGVGYKKPQSNAKSLIVQKWPGGF